MDVGARCSLRSVPVLIEQGVTSPASIDCGTYATILGEYRETFVDSWGAVALEEEQWTLRVRAGAVADAAGHTGVTYHHSRVVDIAEAALETFPHELRHVQLGPRLGRPPRLVQQLRAVGGTGARRGRARVPRLPALGLAGHGRGGHRDGDVAAGGDEVPDDRAEPPTPRMAKMTPARTRPKARV